MSRYRYRTEKNKPSNPEVVESISPPAILPNRHPRSPSTAKNGINAVTKSFGTNRVSRSQPFFGSRRDIPDGMEERDKRRKMSHLSIT
jgi:hypothetical protein